MFGNNIFGDSEVGNMASQAVGNVVNDMFNSNGLKSGIGDTVMGITTSGLSNSKNAGARAAGSVLNSVGS